MNPTGATETSFSVAAAAKWVAALIAAQYVAIPSAVWTLICFMAIDFASGIGSAVISGQGLSSKTGGRGLAKKLMTLLVILLAHMVEGLAHTELHLEQIAAYGYTVNEVISTLENLAKAGVPIPSQLLTAATSVKNLRVKAPTAEQIAELEK